MNKKWMGLALTLAALEVAADPSALAHTYTKCIESNYATLGATKQGSALKASVVDRCASAREALDGKLSAQALSNLDAVVDGAIDKETARAASSSEATEQ